MPIFFLLETQTLDYSERQNSLAYFAPPSATNKKSKYLQVFQRREGPGRHRVDLVVLQVEHPQRRHLDEDRRVDGRQLGQML